MQGRAMPFSFPKKKETVEYLDGKQNLKLQRMARGESKL
jgi:hypothetical protein